MPFRLVVITPPPQRHARIFQFSFASRRGGPTGFPAVRAADDKARDEQRCANKLKVPKRCGSTNFANCWLYFGQVKSTARKQIRPRRGIQDEGV
jgi:hypothetical protein